jgi:hypothetical protein
MEDSLDLLPIKYNDNMPQQGINIYNKFIINLL